MSLVYGMVPGSFVTLFPAYTNEGILLRITGGIVGLFALVVLVLIRQRIPDQSFRGTLGRVSLIFSTGCIFWEISPFICLVLFFIFFVEIKPSGKSSSFWLLCDGGFDGGDDGGGD